MPFQNELIILSLIIILVGVIGCIVVFAARRRMKSKLLIIEKDMRNPNLPQKKYWAIHNKKAGRIDLYSSLIKPWKDSFVPPFNLQAYIHDSRIYCLQGVTGNPDDNNIVPIHYTLAGKTGAKEFSSELAGAVVNTENFIKECQPFRAGQEVSYSDKRKGKDYNIPSATITAIGYEGIQISYEVPATTKGVASTETRILTLSEPALIKGLASITSDEDVRKLPETQLSNFFSSDWVLRNLGIIPVDDVNAILEKEKDMVASYNSKLDERRTQRMSWAARHGAELLIITFFMVSVVSLIIFYSAFTTDITSVIGQAHGVSTTATNAVSILPLPKVG